MALNPQDLAPGEEQFEPYTLGRCQYCYRDHDRTLFVCVARDLGQARLMRDRWIARKGSAEKMAEHMSKRVAERATQLARTPGFAEAVASRGLKTAEEIRNFGRAWALATLYGAPAE